MLATTAIRDLLKFQLWAWRDDSVASCLPLKGKDQFEFQNLYKKARLFITCKHSTGEVETVKSLGLIAQPVQPNQ